MEMIDTFSPENQDACGCKALGISSCRHAILNAYFFPGFRRFEALERPCVYHLFKASGISSDDTARAAEDFERCGFAVVTTLEPKRLYVFYEPLSS